MHIDKVFLNMRNNRGICIVVCYCPIKLVKIISVPFGCITRKCNTEKFCVLKNSHKGERGREEGWNKYLAVIGIAQRCEAPVE